MSTSSAMKRYITGTFYSQLYWLEPYFWCVRFVRVSSKVAKLRKVKAVDTDLNVYKQMLNNRSSFYKMSMARWHRHPRFIPKRWGLKRITA